MTATLALVVLAACGGGGGASGAGGASSADTALGLDKKGLQRRQLKVEAIVATCMKGQGFDYVPLDPTNLRPGTSGQVGLPNLTEDEFRRQYGYGLTTLVGVTTSTGAAVSTNPNQKIRDALASSDQAAYDRALTGGKTDGSFVSAVSQGDFSNLGGCYKQATEQVFGGPEVLSAVQTALDDLDKRVASDPRIAVATRKWSDCINQAGFRFSISDEIDKYLTDKLTAIVGPTASFTSATTYDKAALAALQQEELKLAELDHSCDLKFTKPITDTVTAEVEKAFVEQNPKLIGKVKG